MLPLARPGPGVDGGAARRRRFVQTGLPPCSRRSGARSAGQRPSSRPVRMQAVERLPAAASTRRTVPRASAQSSGHPWRAVAARCSRSSQSRSTSASSGPSTSRSTPRSTGTPSRWARSKTFPAYGSGRNGCRPSRRRSGSAAACPRPGRSVASARASARASSRRAGSGTVRRRSCATAPRASAGCRRVPWARRARTRRSGAPGSRRSGRAAGGSRRRRDARRPGPAPGR